MRVRSDHAAKGGQGVDNSRKSGSHVVKTNVDAFELHEGKMHSLGRSGRKTDVVGEGEKALVTLCPSKNSVAPQVAQQREAFQALGMV